MKLGSLKSGRDGRLVVVSDDLAWCAAPPPMYPTLQSVLDDWDRAADVLEGVALSLAHDAVPHARFHERDAAAPLPRAFQWVHGSAAANHAAPLLVQGRSDHFTAPRDPIALPAVGLDFGAGVVVITGDVPQGATRAQALAAIRLVGLANAFALLGPDADAPDDRAAPACALSPVLVTPAALGARWQDGRLHGTLGIDVNGQPLGRVATDAGMAFDFGTLIAHLAAYRSIGAGSIIASGTLANPQAGGGQGHACIAAQRQAETLRHGAPVTPWLAVGDNVRVEMLDDKHHAIFGTIEQTVVAS